MATDGESDGPPSGEPKVDADSEHPLAEPSTGEVRAIAEPDAGNLSAPGSEPARPQINAVLIKNFKKISETKIELGPITYLVGGNNSGKSSVLQAIHTAVSCAQASVELGQKVIAETSLRYSPVADFSLLGHRAPYENRSTGQRGVVEFEGEVDDSVKVDYRIEMYKARNHNNVGVDRSGTTPGFGEVICDPKVLFSVYVPGLAGVPHREEMSGYAAVFRKAASGDANLVFRNIIRLLDDRRLLGELEQLLCDVLKMPVHFWVNYDSDRDLYVDVRLATGTEPTAYDYLPVDLWGTGILQVTQIFAYVLLFRPSLLLIDEPDSHLHPSRQKSLGVALERVSRRFNCKILVSTHSRHLITGASEAVKVVWMKDGKVESDDNRELTALLMDLGALDQLDSSPSAILCTEDENPRALEMALESLNLSNSVKIASFNGLNNSFTAEAFREMAAMMSSSPRVIIHRDRDFLTDNELATWSKVFFERSIEVFCPTLCDTEAYHTTPEHISRVTGMSLQEAQVLRRLVITENDQDFRAKFRTKRQDANRKYSPDSGSPATLDLWPEGAEAPDSYLYGKKLLTAVDHKLRTSKHLKQGDSLANYPSEELVEQLKTVWEAEPSP